MLCESCDKHSTDPMEFGHGIHLVGNSPSDVTSQPTNNEKRLASNNVVKRLLDQSDNQLVKLPTEGQVNIYMCMIHIYYSPKRLLK